MLGRAGARAQPRGAWRRAVDLCLRHRTAASNPHSVPQRPESLGAGAAGRAMPLSYVTVDVFTDDAFGGNPLAVVFGGEHLSTEQMHAITRECTQTPTPR